MRAALDWQALQNLFERQKCFFVALVAHSHRCFMFDACCRSVYYYRMTKGPSGIARLGDLFTSYGLSRPIDGSSVSAPETLSLAGDDLLWSAKSELRKIEIGPMLERFLALETRVAGNRDVLEFARAYGPLWLCKHHNFVAFHQPVETIECNVLGQFPDAPHYASEPSLICLPRIGREPPLLYSEPVSEWRRHAANANQLLEAAATMQRGANVAPEKWHQIDGLAPDHPNLSDPILSDPRGRLAENLNRWLAIADVRFHVGIEDRSIRPQLGANRRTGSVLALIALDLVAATARAAAVERCSSCSRLFFMSASQPMPGKRVGHATARRIYCSTCRAARIPARDAAQAARDRKKAAEAAHKSGKGRIR